MLELAINNYLEERGIKKTFVAEKANITPRIMFDICNGKRKVACDEYYRICKVLDVPLEFFFERGER